MGRRVQYQHFQTDQIRGVLVWGDVTEPELQALASAVFTEPHTVRRSGPVCEEFGATVAMSTTMDEWDRDTEIRYGMIGKGSK